MGQEDVDTFDELKAKGIKFDVRKVPNDSKSEYGRNFEKKQK